MSRTLCVQEGYVNVGRGNLTFLNRDLVTVGRIPIVAGRVYDSSANAGDFGPGWRFSLHETLARQTDDSLVYTDESGSAQILRLARQSLRPEHASLSDVHSAQINNDSVVLLFREGWRKQFDRMGKNYRLSQVTDPNGNTLVFRYRQNRLVRVESGQRWVELLRNADGTIASISDDQKRSVQYRYDNGLLREVIDRGGQRWQLHYDSQDKLTGITDPLDQIAFSARFHADGTVRSAAIRGSENHYTYEGATTVVTDSEKNIHRYTQHASGLTEEIHNGLGTVSALRFDDHAPPRSPSMGSCATV